MKNGLADTEMLMVRFIVKSVCSGDANGHRSHPDAPHGRSQSARRTGGGGASYALHGLALQEGEDIFTCPVLATGNRKCQVNWEKYV